MRRTVFILAAMWPAIAGRAWAWSDPGDLLFTLMPDVPVAGQDFADALAMDGDYVLVGAEDTMQDGVPTVGAAYLFEAATGNQLHKIMLPGPAVTRAFGTSVDIDGNLMVIGASDEGGVQGAAYVFNTNGTQLFKLLATGGGPLHEFGDTVAISGNHVVVSAPNAAGPEGAGLAYLFDLTGATPGSTLMGTALTQPADLPAFPNFASTIDIDGDRIVIGLDQNGNGGGSYVYDTDGNLLRRLTTPFLPGTMTEVAGFGRSVGISDGIAIVGATPDENQVLTEIGRAYLFDVETGDLLFELLPDSSRPADLFSDVVEISGNLALVSQRLEELYPTDPTAINTGFLFDVTTGQQILQLPGDGVTKGIEAYEALAISGGRAVVGLEGIGKALLVDTLIGDYNRDGKITAADYTTWRNSLGDTVEAYMGADGNGDTVIGIADYLLWKANYGVAAPMPISLGAGAATSQAIPEPTSWLNVLLAAVTAGTAMRWRSKLAGRPARR